MFTFLKHFVEPSLQFFADTNETSDISVSSISSPDLDIFIKKFNGLSNPLYNKVDDETLPIKSNLKNNSLIAK